VRLLALKFLLGHGVLSFYVGGFGLLGLTWSG